MAGSLNRWKKEIHKRDNYTCFYCGDKFDIDELHLDHIFPKSRGGKDKKDNLITACEQCNLIKGNLTVEEFHTKVIEKFLFHKNASGYFLKIMSKLEMRNV